MKAKTMRIGTSSEKSALKIKTFAVTPTDLDTTDPRPPPRIRSSAALSNRSPAYLATPLAFCPMSDDIKPASRDTGSI